MGRRTVPYYLVKSKALLFVQCTDFVAPSDEGAVAKRLRERKTDSVMRFFVLFAIFRCSFSSSGLRPHQREALIPKHLRKT